ncbi:MAG TPA: hypothetical protein VFV40_04115 [Nocardioides sp.]|nr:hypothetical protein [Nocardioides sp.]
MAYGGRASTDDGRLPAAHRTGSALAAVLLLGIGWLLLASGAVVSAPFDAGDLEPVLWGLAGLFALNTVANLGGRHPVERVGATAVTAALTVLCALLALR